MIRHPEAIVFKVKGVRPGEVFRLIIDDVLAKASDWTGPATCVAVFKLHMVRPEQTEDVVWPDVMIPLDADGIEQLLLSSDEIESIQHKRNFLPNEKPKPRAKKKPQPKGPFSKYGHDLDKWSSRYHRFFDNEELVAEGNDLRVLMKGYPFEDRTPLENSRYIELEVIHRLRDRFPTMYDLDIILGGSIKEALTLISKPDIQKYGRPDDFDLAHCFYPVQTPNVVESYLARLQGLDWMIRTGRIKDRDRKIVDPTDDEGSQDKYFMMHGGGNNDRDFTDDLAEAEAEECSA